MLKVGDMTIKNLKAGKFKFQLSEFYDLKKVIENNRFHNNQSVFDHTITALEKLTILLKNKVLKSYLSKKIGDKTRKQLLFLATVFHDIGKKDTLAIKGGESFCFGHERCSSCKAIKIVDKFDLTKIEKQYTIKIIKNHGKLHDLMTGERNKLEAGYQNLKNKYPDIIFDLLIFTKADTMGLIFKKEDMGEINFRINFYNKAIKELLQ